MNRMDKLDRTVREAEIIIDGTRAVIDAFNAFESVSVAWAAVVAARVEGKWKHHLEGFRRGLPGYK